MFEGRGDEPPPDAARRRVRRLLLATWLAASALGLTAWGLGAFHAAELGIVDAHFSLRGSRAPNPRIALVLIDAKTLQNAHRYPLPRSLHAQVIDRLRADRARVIAYDVV